MPPATLIRSSPFRLLHMNIRGTPRMSAEKVHHDVEVAVSKGGVVTLVEFRWDYYWRILARVVGAFLTPAKRRAKGRPTWRSFPTFKRGIAAPVAGGQMIAWKGRRWKRAKTLARLLHRGMAGISEDRRIRGVLLIDREVLLGWWVLVAHFVVGGDNDEDSDKRERILDQNVEVTRRAVIAALATGYPVSLTMDANIRETSDAFRQFKQRVVTDLGGTIHGAPGVEYLITYPGTNGTVIDVGSDWTVPTSQINTDHEGRGITATLVQRVA